MKDELTKELLQYQEKGTEVNARTVEVYCKHGNTDISELMVIDEIARSALCQEHNAKGMTFCKCGSFLPELHAGMKETLKDTTKQVMVRLSSLQWRKGRTRGHAGSIQKAQNIKLRSITTEKHRTSNSKVVQTDV